MKRWFSGLLAAWLLISLTACGGAAGVTGTSSGSQSARLEEEKVDLPTADPDAPEDPADPEEVSDPEETPGPEVPADPDITEAAGLPEKEGNAPEDNHAEDVLPENGSYTTKDDVALYIHTYGRLPDNFITKKEAQNLGWPGGDLEPYAPGMCIGGSRFGNYEGLLPDAKGRIWTECDIDTLGAQSRGAKRIVFSNDGLVYYTEDHYQSFELLYGGGGDG